MKEPMVITMAREYASGGSEIAQAVADKLGIGLRYYQDIEAGKKTGGFAVWDALEDLFSVHQRELRQCDRADNR